MRLWTLHPRYLDAQGLTALWREGLLAQRVLRGRTRGYRHHPQLARFRETHAPVAAIRRYLAVVHEEACARGYRFNAAKIRPARFDATIPVGSGQLRYEWRQLKARLRARAPHVYRRLRGLRRPAAHPLFRIVPGPVADWERPQRAPARRAPPKRRIMRPSKRSIRHAIPRKLSLRRGAVRGRRAGGNRSV
ncbi:MAG: pyrimidine dimer DNA glycosylase/endonuclease V [Sulfurifustis sp.]